MLFGGRGTSVVQKQGERVEDKHEEEGVEDSQAALDAVVDEVEQACQQAPQVDQEQRHYDKAAIFRDLSGHEPH